MPPILLVPLLSQESRQLGPVADPVDQGMNKNLTSASGKRAGGAGREGKRAFPIGILGGDGKAAQVFDALVGQYKEFFRGFAAESRVFGDGQVEEAFGVAHLH